MEAEILPDPHILYLLGSPPKRLLYAKHCCVHTVLGISYRGKQDRYDSDSKGAYSLVGKGNMNLIITKEICNSRAKHSL